MVEKPKKNNTKLNNNNQRIIVFEVSISLLTIYVYRLWLVLVKSHLTCRINEIRWTCLSIQNVSLTNFLPSLTLVSEASGFFLYNLPFRTKYHCWCYNYHKFTILGRITICAVLHFTFTTSFTRYLSALILTICASTHSSLPIGNYKLLSKKIILWLKLWSNSMRKVYRSH